MAPKGPRFPVSIRRAIVRGVKAKTKHTVLVSRYNISLSSINRIMLKHHQYNSLEDLTAGKPPYKIDEKIFREISSAHPDDSAGDIAKKLADNYGIYVNRSTVGRNWKRLGIKRRYSFFLIL